jgi:sodium/bile acid cotransporter 7
MIHWWSRLRPDNFTLALLATVALATVAPMTGAAAKGLDHFTDLAIAALFFLHGARLPRESIVAGMLHWRLHLVILSCTFVLFPLLGLAFKPLAGWALTPELFIGVLFLCALPSTVQSSIAFTSMAGGNVPAAVCAASLSSILGVFLTPLLMTLLTGAEGGIANPLHAVGMIMLQLLVPFVAGHLLRPWIAGWVVYAAFGESVNEGLWHKTPALSLLTAALVSVVLLAIAMPGITWLSRRLGFSRYDEIPIVFCGSKKSLATGVPIAKVLFAGGSLGAIVLPIMIYHQLQLIVCALIAQRYARQNGQ